jgi:deferrochelatase/peroxidase EfeB
MITCLCRRWWVSSAGVDFSNIQAIIVRPYGYPFSRHLIFHFGAAASGKSFLRDLLAKVTTADQALDSKPEPLLNVGITHRGLGALGLPSAILDSFDAVFKEGPDGGALGDLAPETAPSTWWEKQFLTEDVHCIVSIYCRTENAQASVSNEVRTLASGLGHSELRPRKDGASLDGRSLGGGRVHFGYRDGIGQPAVNWTNSASAIADSNQVHYRHFLLGYSNVDVPSYPSAGPGAAFAKDSTYMVFRWVYQDVAAFNRFLSEHVGDFGAELSSKDAEELLAAKLIGRWRDGTPLVVSPDRPLASEPPENNFLYSSADPQGMRCPFSAHIRIANPRDQELDSADKIEAFPRLIRRGMPYGPELNSTEDDGVDRGLLGNFLCSDIRRQFYTIMGWLNQNSFSPVFAGNRQIQDPICGNRSKDADTSFRVPTSAGPRVIRGLPAFTRTKGTAFLLVPSRKTLAVLAAS